jgi:hypothetical protein
MSSHDLITVMVSETKKRDTNCFHQRQKDRFFYHPHFRYVGLDVDGDSGVMMVMVMVMVMTERCSRRTARNLKMCGPAAERQPRLPRAGQMSVSDSESVGRATALSQQRARTGRGGCGEDDDACCVCWVVFCHQNTA